MKSTMYGLRRIQHIMYCDKISRDKRYWLDDGRGSLMVWEINMGVCPRLEFDNIMFNNCLGYDFYIYGAFEFSCNCIANL